MWLKVATASVRMIILVCTALWSIADRRRGGVGGVPSDFRWPTGKVVVDGFDDPDRA